MKQRFAVALALGALCTCQRLPSPSDPATPADAVARFGDFVITSDAVDARILALPPAERPKPGEDLDSWYRSQIRELAVEQRLRQEADDLRLAESEDFVEAEREAARELTVQLCLADLLPAAEPITEENLRDAFEAQAESLSAPERRNVYHVYLRRSDGGDARARIEALRDRALGGESFLRLAADHSESESRHRDGAIGWIRQGQLPEGFERVIFRLEEGVPSEPVETRDGFHLFYVDQILPAQTMEFEEARPMLQKQLAIERQAAAFAEVERTMSAPAESLTLDRQAFERLVEAEDLDAPVLRLGDVEITLRQLRRRVRQTVERTPSSAVAGPPTLEMAWNLLEGLRRRAAIYHHCRQNGLVAEEDLEPRLGQWRELRLIVLQRERRMQDLVRQDQERLRLFYDSNVGQFSSAVQWNLRRLKVASGDNPKSLMTRLESAARRQIGLQALQAEIGGDLEDLGPKTLAELRLISEKLPPLVSPLEPGGVSDPYRNGDQLEIVELQSRVEAQPLPFDEEETLERVAAAYVKAYRREVYRELADEILATAELEIDGDVLAAVRDAGSTRQDISVEELEQALDQL